MHVDRYVCNTIFIVLHLETGKKSLNDGAIPKLSLPEKSHESRKFAERQHRNIVHEGSNLLSKEKVPLYKSFNEFANRVRKLKLKTSGWHVEELPNKVTFKLIEKPYLVPKFEVVVDETLSYTCAAYGWLLPDDHKLYKSYKRSVRNITISGLLSIFKSTHLCPGADVNSEELLSHCIPCALDLDKTSEHPQQAMKCSRSKDCMVLMNDEEICSSCCNFFKEFNRKERVKEKKSNVPAQLNAPLSKTNPHRVKLALQEERIKTSQLKKQVERMEQEIKSKGIKP